MENFFTIRKILFLSSLCSSSGILLLPTAYKRPSKQFQIAFQVTHLRPQTTFQTHLSHTPNSAVKVVCVCVCVCVCVYSTPDHCPPAIVSAPYQSRAENIFLPSRHSSVLPPLRDLSQLRQNDAFSLYSHRSSVIVTPWELEDILSVNVGWVPPSAPKERKALDSVMGVKSDIMSKCT